MWQICKALTEDGKIRARIVGGSGMTTDGWTATTVKRPSSRALSMLI
ncbi:hypothetical protein ACLBOM_22490 [Escherichia coli]